MSVVVEKSKTEHCAVRGCETIVAVDLNEYPHQQELLRQACILGIRIMPHPYTYVGEVQQTYTIVVKKRFNHVHDVVNRTRRKKK